MRHATALLCVLAVCTAVAVEAAQDTGSIKFPDGYRSWFHHHSTVNLEGHEPKGNVGIQHVYANDLAMQGLKSGKFEAGATFVVDRFEYDEVENKSLGQGERKVVAVMVRDEARYPETGGWGFQAFKGGNPAQQVVKDGGAQCFTCHIPLAENNYLFTRGVQ